MKKEKTNKRLIKKVLTKHKGILKAHIKRVPFKEPIAFIIRRTGKVDFEENVKGVEYQFLHSEGKERRVWLNPRKLLDFEAGQDTFKGYLIDEDSAVCLPEDPIFDSSMVNTVIDKTLHDVKDHLTERIEARGELIKKIFWGITIVILAIGIFYLLVPKQPEIVQTIAQSIPLSQMNST